MKLKEKVKKKKQPESIQANKPTLQPSCETKINSSKAN